MELRHIALEELKLTNVNVRHGKAEPDVSDILPSIRARGILQPLLVRPNGKGFEVVAGRRRFFALTKVSAETGSTASVPCAIIDKGDDTAALEASLLENLARLPMDPMDQYEAFARLLKEGREIPAIAETFGITERMVRRILALANLSPAIRTAYRHGDIDEANIRILTMASKAKQKEWLALLRDEETYAPMGEQLKRWLLGGDKIKTDVALFDLDAYDGEIVSDLFGEDHYFGDAAKFWALQQAAIAERKQALLDAGWTSVEVLDHGAFFHEWDHEVTTKKKGGRVFVSIRHDGEVTLHEGYVSRAEARSKARKAETGADVSTEQAAKPEITKAMENYLGLHRHILVRAALLGNSGVALRLAVAHMIAGSGLWSIRPEPQRAAKDEIAASVQASALQEAFNRDRAEILTLLDLDPKRADLVRHTGDTYWAALALAKLLTLGDNDVMRILTFAMAESLEAGSCLVEALGKYLAVDATGQWQGEDSFVSLLSGKASINAVLKSIAGEAVADGNKDATGKVQKGIISDFLTGSNGRERHENWVPDWFKFPIQTLTGTPIETLAIGAEWKRVAPMFADLVIADQ